MSKNNADLFDAGYITAYDVVKKYFTDEIAADLKKHVSDYIPSNIDCFSDNRKKEFYQGMDIGIINAILDKLSFSS